MSAHVINVDINGNLKLNDVNGLASQVEKWQASGVTLPVKLQESFTKLKSEIAKGGVAGGQVYAQTFMQNFAKEIKRGSFTQQNMRMIQSYFGESFVKAAQHHGSEYVKAMQTSARKEAAAQRTKFNDELGKISSREYESLYGRAYAAAKIVLAREKTQTLNVNFGLMVQDGLNLEIIMVYLLRKMLMLMILVEN